MGKTVPLCGLLKICQAVAYSLVSHHSRRDMHVIIFPSPVISDSSKREGGGVPGIRVSLDRWWTPYYTGITYNPCWRALEVPLS